MGGGYEGVRVSNDILRPFCLYLELYCRLEFVFECIFVFEFVHKIVFLV